MPAGRFLVDIPINRENLKILGSVVDGTCAAILYTDLEIAGRYDLDPQAYLAYVIDFMAKVCPVNPLSECLPWNWERRFAKLTA